MKRVAIVCIILLLFIVIIGLLQPAVDPGNFNGLWYSANDQSAYLFEDGLIYCSRYSAAMSDEESISGAYTYCKGSIFLFAMGIDGLETERELYLVQQKDGSFLCENRDGSGITYFIRYKE